MPDGTIFFTLYLTEWYLEYTSHATRNSKHIL